MQCRLEPIKAAAKTVKNHLWGIINSIILKVSNGPAEDTNSRIKTVKMRGQGFRNMQRFADAIYFHLRRAWPMISKVSVDGYAHR